MVKSAAAVASNASVIRQEVVVDTVTVTVEKDLVHTQCPKVRMRELNGMPAAVVQCGFCRHISLIEKYKILGIGEGCIPIEVH
jgi:hypothetical protein